MLRKGAQLRGGHVHRDGGQIELLQPRADLLFYETARLLILHCDATDDDSQRRVAAVGMARGSNVWRLTQFRPRVQARPAPEEGLIGPLGPSKKSRQSLLAQDNRVQTTCAYLWSWVRLNMRLQAPFFSHVLR